MYKFDLIAVTTAIATELHCLQSAAHRLISVMPRVIDYSFKIGSESYFFDLVVRIMIISMN